MLKQKRASKLNILVVEDEQVSLDMLLLILASSDKIKGIPAKSGKEAIELYEKNRIDCTFLDIDIPAPDGIETLKKIREMDNEAIVVMQTARGDAATVKKTIELGASGYIVKPYEPEKIFDVLNKLFV